MNRIIPFLLIFCFTGVMVASLQAQSDQAIGQWKSYLPYTLGRYVTQSSTEVYYASDFSLLSINKEENSVRRLTKTDGLSDVGIRIVKYSPFTEVLIVIYENGNVDLVKPNRIVNLPFIKNEEILGDRNIYNVYYHSAERAFLSTGFGILELNPENETFTNDIRTGISVYSVATYDGYIYAGTAEGIYRAVNSPQVNLQDFTSNWSLLDQGEGFPSDYSTNTMTVYQDKLFFNLDNTLYSFDGNSLSMIHEEAGYEPHFLSADGSHLLAGFRCLSGCNDKVLAFNPDLTPTTLAGDCINRSEYAVEDQNGRIWFADLNSDFRVLSEVTSGSCERMKIDGPPTGNIWDIDVQRNQVWIATGGYTDQYIYLFRSEGIISYIDGEWKSYNRFNRVEMRGNESDPAAVDDDLYDMVTVAVSPSQNKVFAGSYIEGIIEFDVSADTMYLYNEKNSSIGEVSENDPGRTRITGMALDPEGNLWVTNFLSARPFSVFTREGEWKSFSTAGCNNYIRLVDIAIDQSNNKWMMIEDDNAGLMVFHEGDPDDPSDDQCRVISTGNSNLPTNSVNSIAVDLDGDVWVGTEDGVVVFECGSAVFDREVCRGNLRIVNVGGDNEYLLKGENVSSIAVDGANRKWFGTSNGVFVQNSNGDEQIAAFNETNSPLFDNNVIDIAINQENGEVFIATNRGLISYRTDAVAGTPIHSGDVKVFPNPVRPEYDGPIAIDGLARDANVKITDLNGQLVYETTALGGQAIWNGKDYNGRKAASGVYLVFSTTTGNLDSPDAVVAKILFIN